MSLMKNIGGVFAPVMDLELDDILEPLGLRTRPGVFSVMAPAVGLVLAGVAIGAGLGMILAPTSGRRMREQVQHRIEGMKDRFQKNSFDQTNVGGNLPVEIGNSI